MLDVTDSETNKYFSFVLSCFNYTLLFSTKLNQTTVQSVLNNVYKSVGRAVMRSYLEQKV